MSRVSLSRRDAEAIASLVETRHPGWLANQQDAIDRLRAALLPKPKKVAATKARKAAKGAKRAAHNAETAEIRAEVVSRATGIAGPMCEACACEFVGARGVEMDHFWGRGKTQQSAANCWLLCRSCHRNKTMNRPSASHWLHIFAQHCWRRGFEDEADKARARLASLSDVAEAAALSRREG